MCTTQEPRTANRWPAPEPGPGTLDPMVVSAVELSVERQLQLRGARVPRPAGDDLGALHRYWSTAAAIAGEDLALLVATDLPIGAFGLASYAMISQPTLADALAALGDTFLDRLVPGMQLRVLPVPDGDAEVRLSSEGDDRLMPLLEEIVLAVLHRHLSLLATPAEVFAVSLRRAPPADVGPWRQFFGVAPRFARHASSLRLRASRLGAALRTASPELQAMVRASAGEPTVRERVHAYVRAHLRTEANAEAVARALQMSSRTLQRKLQAEHTSLREIAAATRIEVALEMLEHGDASIAQIADMIGFAQPASFSRAFSAAKGEAPLSYRKRRQLTPIAGA